MISQRQKEGIQKIMDNLNQDTFTNADRTDPKVLAILNAVVERTKSREDALVELNLIERSNNPSTYSAPTPRIEMGRNDHHGKYIKAATDAILVRDHVLSPQQADPDHTEFMELSLHRMARQCLTMAGITPPPHGEKFNTITEALRTRLERGYSTSDFSSLVENIASKAVTLGWDNAPETWQYWTRQTETKNFLEFSRITAPELPTPAEVVEMADIKSATLGNDSAEKSAVKTYAEIVNYSREAMTSDNTQRLTVTAEAAGRAAARLVGNLAYAVLTDNENMSNGSALFSAANANIVGSGSGAAPSVSTLGAIRALMSAQTGPSGEVLNIRPAILLCPTVLESTATTLRDASSASDTDDGLTPGYKAGRFAVVSEARLDAALASGWYMIADPRIFSTVDVVTLEGSRGRPAFEHLEQFKTDGMAFRIKHDVIALPVDYRTMTFNYGA